MGPGNRDRGLFFFLKNAVLGQEPIKFDGLLLRVRVGVKKTLTIPPGRSLTALRLEHVN